MQYWCLHDRRKGLCDCLKICFGTRVVNPRNKNLRQVRRKFSTSQNTKEDRLSGAF